MTTTPSADEAPPPFSALARSVDRERILEEMVELVWSTTLDMPIQRRAEPDLLDAPALIGTIVIGGPWSATITMAATKSLAASCAAVLFGRDADQIADEEIADGWGELVNMVGGNLKALVTAPSKLGLPVVHEVNTLLGDATEGHELNALTFACMGGRVRLAVIRPIA